MKSIKKCNKCGQESLYSNEDCYWQEFHSYSQKLFKCPFCGCVNVIATIEDLSLNINNDERYYDYGHNIFYKNY